jgi:hypothetical protein
MRWWTLLAMWLLVVPSGLAYDGEYEIRPESPDLFPGDGFMEEGSYSNPYVFRLEE